jgi:hypothetical protein
MIKPGILIVVTFFFSNILLAQKKDSLLIRYQNQTIYRYGNWFIKGNEKLDFRDLRNEFQGSELGMIGYEKAKKYRSTSMVMRIGATLSSLVVLAIISNNGSRSTSYVLIGGQFVLGFGSIRYNSLAAQSLDRAIWHRNKDLLFPEK